MIDHLGLKSADEHSKDAESTKIRLKIISLVVACENIKIGRISGNIPLIYRYHSEKLLYLIQLCIIMSPRYKITLDLHNVAISAFKVHRYSYCTLMTHKRMKPVYCKIYSLICRFLLRYEPSLMIRCLNLIEFTNAIL